jgi:hypothetical protein
MVAVVRFGVLAADCLLLSDKLHYSRLGLDEWLKVADLVLPPAIKKQLKDRAKEVSLKNLRPETATIQ